MENLNKDLIAYQRETAENLSRIARAQRPIKSLTRKGGTWTIEYAD